LRDKYCGCRFRLRGALSPAAFGCGFAVVWGGLAEGNLRADCQSAPSLGSMLTNFTATVQIWGAMIGAVPKELLALV